MSSTFTVCTYNKALAKGAQLAKVKRIPSVRDSVGVRAVAAAHINVLKNVPAEHAETQRGRAEKMGSTRSSCYSIRKQLYQHAQRRSGGDPCLVIALHSVCASPRDHFSCPSAFANFARFARVLLVTASELMRHRRRLTSQRMLPYSASVLLTNEIVVLSGDQEGTLIVPWPPYT